jgi:archaellum component FlaG (FlaF/FlaG flagellin family)
MNHDVFICHSSKDRTIANAICSTLEQNRIRCWIAPRDVLPGTDYGQSIIEAIAGSALTVLVFSDSSNHSPHVKREIERTVSHGIPILPFRVDDVIPSPSLEYFISDAHWLDAITPPMEQHLLHLVGTVRLLLGRADTTSVVGSPMVNLPKPMPVPGSTGEAPAAPASTAVRLPSWWRWAALAAAVIVTLAVVGVLVLGRNGGGGTGVSGATPPSRGPTSSVSGTTPSTPGGPSARAAQLGQAITLTGIDPATRAAVTVTKVVDPTTATDGISAPLPGNRFVAVEITIKNTGTVAFEETPVNCARLVDGSGRGFDTETILSVAAGPVFDTSVRLRPGEQATGYVVFDIPTSAEAAYVQFALDSGVSDDSGAWALAAP